MPADIVGIASGTFHSVLLRKDGSVWSTGFESNDRGEGFVQVFPGAAMGMAAGNGFSMVLTRGGTVWTSVKKSETQFSFIPFVLVKDITGATAVSAGGYHGAGGSGGAMGALPLPFAAKNANMALSALRRV